MYPSIGVGVAVTVVVAVVGRGRRAHVRDGGRRSSRRSLRASHSIGGSNRWRWWVQWWVDGYGVGQCSALG